MVDLAGGYSGRTSTCASLCGCLVIEACKYSSQLYPAAPMWQELQAVRSRLREEAASEYRCCQRGHAGAPVRSPPGTRRTLQNWCSGLVTETSKNIIHCLNIIKPGNLASSHILAGLFHIWVTDLAFPAPPPSPERQYLHVHLMGPVKHRSN